MEEEEEDPPDLNPQRHSLRASPKAAEAYVWDSSPLRQIPIAPAIRRHGPPMETPSYADTSADQ